MTQTERQMIAEARREWVRAGEPYSLTGRAHTLYFRVAAPWVACQCLVYLNAWTAIGHVVLNQPDLRQLEPLPDIVKGPVFDL